MMVRDEDVRHPPDAELGEVVENAPAAEVDEHGLAAVHEHVHVARVAEARDARADLFE